MRIYVDLDETLIANVLDQERENVLQIIPRPGVQWFLRTLAMHGEICLLTASMRKHAQRALQLLRPESRLFKCIITYETMEPIAEQLQVVRETPGLTDDERMNLWEEIRPLAPPGIVFDDAEVGTYLWALKSKAVGIDDSMWINVESYLPGLPDRQGLKRAYSEFVARFGNQGLGRRRRKVHAWR